MQSRRALESSTKRQTKPKALSLLKGFLFWAAYNYERFVWTMA